MPPSAVVIDPQFLKHDPGPFHPESPERLRVLLELAGDLEGEGIRILPPRSATREEIGTCHSGQYIDLIQSTSRANRYALDGDTVTSMDSFGTALLAAGGYLRLLDAVAQGEFRNGFALVRPPGHHALRNRAMGFCLFNTVAIGARHLKRHYGAERILIMDWDVHHGNGTQDAFFTDPTVLYLSTHQFPFYPGTGSIEETGEAEGAGYTVNVPLPSGCGDAEYLEVFQRVVIPIASRYEPQWVLVSAGFDPHRDDPLAGMRVTEQGFGAMAASLLELAERFSGGRIAFLLEGGYNLLALKSSVATVLQTMAGEVKSPLPVQTGGVKIDALIRKVLKIQEEYRQKDSRSRRSTY